MNMKYLKTYESINISFEHQFSIGDEVIFVADNQNMDDNPICKIENIYYYKEKNGKLTDTVEISNTLDTKSNQIWVNAVVIKPDSNGIYPVGHKFTGYTYKFFWNELAWKSKKYNL